MQQENDHIINMESQAQQLLQAQQIANILYSSHQNISGPSHRSPMSQANFGSTPHITQLQSPQQTMNYNNSRHIRDSHQFINDQGQYIAPISKGNQMYSSGMNNGNGNGNVGMYQYEQQHQVSNKQLICSLV